MRVFAFAFAFVVAGCGVAALDQGQAPPLPRAPEAEVLVTHSTQSHEAPVAPREVVDAEGSKLFLDAGVDGAFVLADLNSQITTVVNPEQAATGYLPASTFKIPNTLIGLETGVIPDAGFAQKWDGVKRDGPAVWNQDHDLASAMKSSVVWFYQGIARQIGAERMNHWLGAFHYGNRNTSAGIDQFWLRGAMRVTPREQVAFLRKLRARSLPVSPAHAELVERLITLEETPKYTLRAKTGLTTQDEQSVGWLVGFVDQPKGNFAFACVLLVPAKHGAKLIDLRLQLAKQLLRRAGALPDPAAQPAQPK
ncbi:MAG TPA: penicillin-binding transpeptidase domain-containing protein [Polyangiaceae bacterium]|nr:penicillin-binding transpeptidase domain-containing protein [Polyangiaceae bacterium]